MFLIINQPLEAFRQQETLKYLLISRRLLHKEWWSLGLPANLQTGSLCWELNAAWEKKKKKKGWAHLSTAQRCIVFNISWASLLVLSCKCFCPCWGLHVNYSLRRFASAYSGMALHPQTNESWALNMYFWSEVIIKKKKNNPQCCEQSCPLERRCCCSVSCVQSETFSVFSEWTGSTSSRWVGQTEERKKKKGGLSDGHVFSEEDGW